MSLNTAFLFIKPHAVTDNVVSLVESTLADYRVRVDCTGTLPSEDIRRLHIIDRHYSTIYMYAVEKQPSAVRLPGEAEKRFLDVFGVPFDDAVRGTTSNGLKVLNAATALAVLEKSDAVPEGKSPAQHLSELFAASPCKSRLAPGLYAATLTLPNDPNPVVVFNGFYPCNQEKFTAPNRQVRWFVVRWRPEDLSWADFRGKVIGPTDPTKAPEGSLRRLILKDWESLGLTARPDVSDNGVHASAGPVEGFVEQRVWLNLPNARSTFALAAAHRGIPERFLADLERNPDISLAGRPTEPAFDLFEDKDTPYVLDQLAEFVQQENGLPIINTAVVFIKPHACHRPLVKSLVETTLIENGIRVVMEGTKHADTIDEEGLVDKHYSAIARFARDLPGKDLAGELSDDAHSKFRSSFGVELKDVCEKGNMLNAFEAMESIRDVGPTSAETLSTIWRVCDTKAKVAPGLYIGYSSESGKYFTNGFYPSIREKFTAKGKAIHWFVVSWPERDLSWSDFRNKVIGVTDPAAAHKGSLRELILSNWRDLGLEERPNTSDNGIHASAGPLEGIAERLTWVGGKLEDDITCRLLQERGVESHITLRHWITNGVVNKVCLPDGTTRGPGPAFDLLEDMQTSTFIEVVRNAENDEKESQRRNYAFVFVKPHAHTAEVETLLDGVFKLNCISVEDSGVCTGDELAERGIIDRHYSAISSLAMSTRERPAIPTEGGRELEAATSSVLLDAVLPTEGLKAFEDTFGISWGEAAQGGYLVSAQEALDMLDISPLQLAKRWGSSTRCRIKVKVASGVYVGHFSKENIYVVNGFYPAIQSKMTAPWARIQWYAVSWSEERLSWADFRGKVIGPTDPTKAPEGSLRRLILKDWESLGLAARPDVSDNGVHASAGPLEGLAERRVWLKAKIGEDPFGRVLKSRHGLTERFIAHCCSNPGMELDLAPLTTTPATTTPPQEEGVSNLAVVKSGPVFDLLEDMESSVCGSILQRAFEEDRAACMENTALVFLKPHAVNPMVAGLVEAAFKENGMTVLQKGVRNAQEIRNGNLIDTHYTTISHYALHWMNDLERTSEADVCLDENRLAELESTNPLLGVIVDSSGEEGLKSTEAKFSRLFAEPLDYALRTGRLMSAASALKHLQSVRDHTKNAFLNDYTRMSLEAELYDRWNKSDTFMKLAGGAYVKELVIRSAKDEDPSPHVDHNIPSIFVINGFYPQLRHGYLAEPEGQLRVATVMWYVVSWRESSLSWKDFRGKFIGCTDPSAAPDSSLRGAIYSSWKELGLRAKPNTSDNGVHASAGPLEGLVERYIWSVPHPDTEEPLMPPLPVDDIASYLHHDPVGQLLVDHELDPEFIASLCVSPMVTIGGNQAPLFDHTEDMQTSQLPLVILRYLKEKKEKEKMEEESAAVDATRTLAQAIMMEEADANQRIAAVNTAVLLVKPQAAKDGVTEFLKEKLTANHIAIVQESLQSVSSTSTARLKKLVDAHHGDVAVYADEASPKDIHPTEEGLAAFEALAGPGYVARTAGKAVVANASSIGGTTAWDQAVSVGQVINAERAMLELGAIKPTALNARWESIPADKKVEVAPGAIVGHLVEAEMFIVNGHYPHLRDSFISSEAPIHTWVLEWREEDLSWEDFLEGVIGGQDPEEAPTESLVGFLFNNWRSLGLAVCPVAGDVGIHASAGPLQALVERRVWFKQQLETDPFTVECLVKRGVSRETFQTWIANEVVAVSSHVRGRAFDLLAGKQTSEAANIIADAAEFAHMALIPMKKVVLSPKRRLFNATLQDRFIHINTMTSEDEMRELFNYYDKDGSGSIDRREFLSDYLHFETYGQPLQKGRVQDMFTKFDRNQDGRLSFDEFCMAMLERVAHM